MVGSCSWVVRGNDKGAKVMSRGKNRSQGKIQIHSARLFPPDLQASTHLGFRGGSAVAGHSEGQTVTALPGIGDLQIDHETSVGRARHVLRP